MSLLIGTVLPVVLIVNVFLALVTVFREKRDIAATWAWLIVLWFLPLIGFCLYLVVGKRLPRNKIFEIKGQARVGIVEHVKAQKEAWHKRDLVPKQHTSPEVREIVHMFLEADNSLLTVGNKVQIFTDGKKKFAQLFDDIKNAKHHVNVEYYSFYNDEIGRALLRVLEDAARRGVAVHVSYDSFGSHGTTQRFFSKLVKLGGEAEPFFGGWDSLSSSISSLRLNYRMHRKIVVIDGKIGYIGGFNVGDQYLSRAKKFGYWRDTHLRIEGPGVAGLQSRFFMDWNATVKHSKQSTELEYSRDYFPEVAQVGETALQTVSSGPDSDQEIIKLGYLKMITNANESIYIQTPYLIPDDSVIEALAMAALSGVDVKIMVPSIPDHAFVYRATEYYARELAKIKGIRVYKYDGGFLHAKTMVVDGKTASVGSANMDFRSFKLNFEANVFCYDADLAQELAKIFEADLGRCTPMTTKYFAAQSRYLRFKQYCSRLLSPIL